ncbi:MAG: TIR domain-containing protein [Anaerolineaceae bacterium]|nr:MAG: TIR domain-containing protein [Anaerolineaceae bacterium]
MSHIFISYSRKDIDFADKIVQALAENALDTWIDWKSIPKGENWEHEIYRGIEQADAFLFLISPDSVASVMCSKEIDHAVKNGKRILPIVVRDADPKIIHPEISKRNWIFCREGQDDFNKAIEETRKTIRTDYEWLKYHTELQVKALKWEQKKDNSRLLRGKELREAEQQLAEVVAQEDPQLTKVQREYILASQRSEVRQRRQITTSLGFGLAIVALLAIIAWNQRNNALNSEAMAVAEANAKATALANEESARATAQAEKEHAEEQAHIARAGELVAQAEAVRHIQPDLSSLLSIEAFRIANTPRSIGLLLDTLQSTPRLFQYFPHIHTEVVTTIAINPDGKLMASGGSDNSIIIWDTEKRSPIGRPLRAHTSQIESIAFSPDGNLLASASDDKSIILWDMYTYKPLGTPLLGHIKAVTSIAFSPDGKILVSASSDNKIILWDVVTRQPMPNPIDVKGLGIGSLSFSPDGKMVASGSCAQLGGLGVSQHCTKGIITFWNLETRQPIGLPLTAHNGGVKVAFSPDGKILASASDDKTIILWDVATHQPIGQPLSGHTDSVVALTFSPDGKVLLSGGVDKTIIIWDVASSQPVTQPLTGPNGWVYSIAFHPSGNSFFSSGCHELDERGFCRDSEIIQWDLNRPYLISQTIQDDSSTNYTVAISPDGKILASGGYYGDIILWDMVSRKYIGDHLKGHTGPVESVAFHPSGNVLASGSRDKSVMIWDVVTHKIIGEPLIGHTERVSSVAFSPDGKILASGGGDNSVIIWDVFEQKQLTRILLASPKAGLGQGWARSVVFSPDGKTLAIGSSGLITLWDMVTRTTIGEMDITEMVYPGFTSQVADLVYSPDGKILVSSGSCIIFWDAETRMPLGPRIKVISRNLSFSPDGKILASDNLGDLTLIDVASRLQIGQSVSDREDYFKPLNIQSLAFSPIDGGQTLVSGNDYGEVTFWDIDPNSWIEKLCQRLGRNFTQTEWEQYFPGEEYRLTCHQWPAGE